MSAVIERKNKLKYRATRSLQSNHIIFIENYKFKHIQIQATDIAQYTLIYLSFDSTSITFWKIETPIETVLKFISFKLNCVILFSVGVIFFIKIQFISMIFKADQTTELCESNHFCCVFPLFGIHHYMNFFFKKMI